ncbi:MAG: serine/threonine-protein kinase, partial [Fimbriiglobus sp.]
MPAECPHCRFPVAIQYPSPGRYRPRCSRCGALFSLVIPADPAGEWVTRSLADDTPDPRAKPLDVSLKLLGSSDSRHTAHESGPHLIGSPAATAPPPPRKPAAGSVPDGADDPTTAPPSVLPGYRIERILGHGGMGTVYLARQLSLDRPVALKVMSKRWNRDAVFVARFIREAYAAALLNHPNVVQIHDIGEDHGTRFFSMEYVPGRTLSDVIKSDGKVDPETAVGYILQAARGLKHAHDRGMIHRDVKPENLLLNEQGMVKVADLGLVKTPDGGAAVDLTESGSGLKGLPPNMTGTKMALGTPAYMAPEQCRDATAVDHRADIYSLGCTLYALVTGRPPYEGGTAVDLMTQHAYRPLVPPDQLVTRVPRELSVVIQKMMAKDPEDRFADMGEVVRVLEGWLGVQHTGTFAPRDEQIEGLEALATAFNAAPTAVFRERLLTAAVTACAAAAVVMLFAHLVPLAFGLAGLILNAAAVYFVLNGVARRTYFFRRVRQLAAGLSVGDWLVIGTAAGVFGVLLGALGLLAVWVAAAVVGAALAAAVRVGLDRRIDRERAAPVAEIERLLRRLRLHGVGEDEVRQFVAKYTGRDWEELFETLFGLEAKLSARAVLLRAGSAGQRETYASWREPLIGLIERVEHRRKAARERKLLERVEQARLVAAGVTETAARDRAAVAAAAIVQKANVFREADARPPGGPDELGAPTLVGIVGKSVSTQFDVGRP